jgi:hypothetical protein
MISKPRGRACNLLYEHRIAAVGAKKAGASKIQQEFKQSLPILCG